MRLLFIDQFSEHSHGWGLIGNGAICFSIGCVCKVSWGLAKLSKAAPSNVDAMNRQVLRLLVSLPG
ncbi:hypothetical protein AAF134_12505 [Synechococcus lacustris Tous-12m]